MRTIWLQEAEPAIQSMGFPLSIWHGCSWTDNQSHTTVKTINKKTHSRRGPGDLEVAQLVSIPCPQPRNNSHDLQLIGIHPCISGLLRWKKAIFRAFKLAEKNRSPYPVIVRHWSGNDKARTINLEPPMPPFDNISSTLVRFGFL